MALLISKNLRKRYKQTIAVDGVDITLEKGQIVGLLGPNGAGKSTLLSLLTLQMRPDSGKIEVLGRDASRYRKETKRVIGHVPQDIVLYEEMSARENLLFFGRLYGLKEKELVDRVDEVLKSIGLTERQHGLVNTFSGGMKRRLNIAASVLHRPEILFLDEPTVGIDPQSRHHIFLLVKALADAGTAILYTTHYMEEAQALCDRVAIIDAGRVIAEGTPEELIRQNGTGDLIDIEVAPAQLSSATTAIRSFPEFEITSTTDGMIRGVVPAVGEILVSLFSKLAEANVTPRRVQIMHPNLEAVFLRLTGKHLRDER